MKHGAAWKSALKSWNKDKVKQHGCNDKAGMRPGAPGTPTPVRGNGKPRLHPTTPASAASCLLVLPGQRWPQYQCHTDLHGPPLHPIHHDLQRNQCRAVYVVLEVNTNIITIIYCGKNYLVDGIELYTILGKITPPLTR